MEDKIDVEDFFIRYIDYSIPPLPDLGIGYETINNAALLCAKCLAFEGYYGFDVVVPEQDAYSIFDSSLDPYFSEKAEYLSDLMVLAIEKNTLKSELIKRNLEHVIDKKHTYVSFKKVAEWIESCNIETTDFFREYFDRMADLYDAALKALYFERLKYEVEKNEIENTKEDASDLLRHKIHENKKLRIQLSDLEKQIEVNKPISQRQENTYITIIGAMLGVLLGKAPNGKPYSVLQSQEAIIDVIQCTYGEAGGLSKRTLEAKFGLANRQIKSRL